MRKRNVYLFSLIIGLTVSNHVSAEPIQPAPVLQTRDGSSQMNGPVNISAENQNARRPIVVTNEQMSQDQINQMALQQTQNTLTNSAARQNVINKDARAQQMDQQVKELMGAHSDEMYRAAADFLPYILKLGNGDPAKMTEVLKNASRNPAAFVKDLPPELRQKITDLSQKAKPLPDVKPVPEQLKP